MEQRFPLKTKNSIRQFVRSGYVHGTLYRFGDERSYVWSGLAGNDFTRANSLYFTGTTISPTYYNIYRYDGFPLRYLVR